MQPPSDINAEQAALWNGPAGRAWVETQAVLDRLFEPFERQLVEAVHAGEGRRVLDIGCGTGAVTLALARRLGPQAECTGVDISGPMVAVARERAASEGSTARFVEADAQVHAFERAAFDTLVSRFGVMFFDDFVQAFANLRRAASSNAAMKFIAWRAADENPFMTTAERAAAPLLPELAARRPGGPGQFAFADRERLAGLLAQGGWTGIDIEPLDVACTLPESELVRYVSWLGPVGAILQKADEATRTRVVRTVRAAFEPFVHGGEVRFTAACWWVQARAAAQPGVSPA
jgi:SAM-dependent methyltransferase